MLLLGPEVNSAAAAADVDAVRLKIGERVRIRTGNSSYTLMMVRPEENRVLIRGGKHFPRTVQARLLGSTLGEKDIRPDALVRGQSMVLSVQGKCIVTSPVRSIDKERRTTLVRVKNALPLERRRTA